MSLILDSRFSRHFGLGNEERNIPKHCANRIIRFMSENINLDELSRFMDKYKGVEKIEGKTTRVVGDFMLEGFFEHVERNKLIDSVKYVESEEGQTWHFTNFLDLRQN